MLASDKREFNLSKPMSAPLPARRVRSTFMSFGFWASTVAFVVIEGDALLDQSEIGHASILFMLGTACLAAGACLSGSQRVARPRMPKNFLEIPCSRPQPSAPFAPPGEHPNALLLTALCQ